MNIKKKFDELTIADNFIFSKVMLNEKLAKHFLEVVLGCKIKSVSYPVCEHCINIRYDAKSVRLDVMLEDDTHTIYNLEMQATVKPGLIKRSRYYQDLIDLDLIQKGGSYEKLNHSIVIFVCTFDLFAEDQYIYRFRNVCQQIPTLELEDGTEKVFVNTKGRFGEVSDEFCQVMKIFNGLIAEGEFAEELQQEVDRVKASEEWRREYMTLQVLLDDTREEARLINLIQKVCIKLQKGKGISEIADELEESEESEETIRRVVNVANKYVPEYDTEAICEELLSEENGK